MRINLVILKRGGRVVVKVSPKSVVEKPKAPEPVVAPTLYHPLLMGSRGGSVLLIRRKLAVRPYIGVFDGATQEAVKQFEADNGIVTDGIVDRGLYSLIMARPEVVASGSHTAWIRVAQRGVGAKETGSWSPNMSARVKAFQQRLGVLADGVVGQDTWRKIEEG